MAELGSKGFAARFVQIDLTKLDTIVGAAADIEAQEGRLDILINNAYHHFRRWVARCGQSRSRSKHF